MKICYDCAFELILINSNEIVLNLQTELSRLRFIETIKQKKSSLFLEDLNYFIPICKVLGKIIYYPIKKDYFTLIIRHQVSALINC